MGARRALVGACWVLVLASEVNGQTRVGPFAGVNLGEFHPGESGVSYSTRPFLAVGAAIDVGFGQSVFLRVEPMFLGRGSDFAVAPDGFLFEEGFSGSLHLDYLELPLFLVVSKRGTGLRPYVMAGPTFGYLLKADARARGEQSGVTQSSEVTDSFKRGDLGVSLGGGVQFLAGPASVFVEARYSQGLWGPANGTVQDPRPKNRGLQAEAGVTFGIGAPEPAAQPPTVRQPKRAGFWMGFGLGYGHASLSCKEPVFYCEAPESAGGATGLLSAGWTLTPRLLLAGEARFWSGHTNWETSSATRDFFLAEGPTLGSASVAAYFYPFRARGFFVEVGTGLSFHEPGREGVPTSWGWSWTAGVGHDFFVAHNISLTPLASVHLARIGDAPLFEVEGVPPEFAELNRGQGLKHTLIEVGLRVTVH